MQDRGKITATQMACALFLCVIATAVLAAPILTYKWAGNAMWISSIAASLVALAIAYIMVELHRLFPGKSIVEYSVDLLGRTVGKLFGLYYLLACLQMSGSALRQFGEFMSISFLSQTPSIVLILSISIVGACMARSGIETIGRCAVLFTPVIVGIYLLHLLPVFPLLKPDRLLPLLENGWTAMLQGALQLQNWYPLYMMLTFLLPFVADKEKPGKWSYVSVLWTASAVTGMMLITIMMFGKATGQFNFPMLVISRYVVALEFFEHIESLMMFFWVLDVFVRTIVNQYIISVGFAQWFGAPSFKPLVLPVSALIVLFTYWSTPNYAELADISTTHQPIYYMVNFILFPALLLLIAKFRRAANGKQTQEAPANGS
ncbi:endospore germination permease [Paenibacillus thailandensis]|uniref:Endospore germination permease n=1 Tax=Paenibacillus thailandensis TaxID=393250 RepID=A0ABW5R1V7_9BACL